jgi:hypothetical protein
MDIQRRLDRKEAAQFLTSHGYRTAPATLAKLACIGGGPAFESFGRRPLYRESDLLAWAKARSTGPRRSTSDPGAASGAGGEPPTRATRPTEPDIDEIVARALRSAGVTASNRQRSATASAGQ